MEATSKTYANLRLFGWKRSKISDKKDLQQNAGPQLGSAQQVVSVGAADSPGLGHWRQANLSLIGRG
jgi:hypothetical protein